MVCPYCERRIPDGSKKCEYCGLTIVTASEQEAKEVKKPNVWLGTLGALVGAVLGGALLLLACRMGGLLGTFLGITLAFFTLMGFRLLGRRLTKGGIMISAALTVLSGYLADRLDWAYRLVEDFARYAQQTGSAEQLNLRNAFLLVPTMLNNGSLPLQTYLINLGVIYGFCALGIYLTLRKLIRRS